MRKRPLRKDEEIGIPKKQKSLSVLNRNREVRSFKNTYRSLYTDLEIIAFCLHSTRQLIAVYGYKLMTLVCYMYIYTVEGYPVTKFIVQRERVDSTQGRGRMSGKIYISDNLMLIATNVAYWYSGELVRYNGYNAKIYQMPCFYDCDENECLYIRDDSPEDSPIKVYSHDLEMIRTFRAYKPGTPIAVCIKGDTMVVLNTKQQSILGKSSAKARRCDGREINILRFSVLNEELLESISFNTQSLPFPKYICLDPLSNVLIGNSFSEKLSVWYRGGRLKCYSTPERNSTQLIGLEMTDSFQIVRIVSFKASIRIYKAKM